MNMFNYDVGRKCLIAEGWCPKASTERIVNAMRQATESSGALVPSILSVIKAHEEPPTHFKVNKFTKTFQVNTTSIISHFM
jgi:V-type H+-transporting ATPase subunit a